MDNRKPVLSIRVVEEMTGLTARQIRYYEKKELLRPIRSTGKQRLYSLEEVEILSAIRDFVDKNGSLNGTKDYLLNMFNDYYKQNKVDHNPIKTGTIRSLYPVDNRNALNEMLKYHK
jgi:MerR family glutamine synthetase transcriptional repressor